MVWVHPGQNTGRTGQRPDLQLASGKMPLLPDPHCRTGLQISSEEHCYNRCGSYIIEISQVDNWQQSCWFHWYNLICINWLSFPLDKVSASFFEILLLTIIPDAVIIIKLCASLAQLAEHLTLNQGVQGSNPWWRTSSKACNSRVAGFFRVFRTELSTALSGVF